MTTDLESTPGYTPSRPTLVAIAVCLVWVIVLFLPMFTGHFLGGDHSDQTWTGIPFRTFWADEFRRTGSIPMWNPFMFGGLPFVGAMHGDIVYPTSFLRLILRADQALNATFFIHMTLAGVFTYAFLRVLGTTWTAAIVGALAYQLSGIVASQVSPGHDGKMIVSALLPLLLTGLVLAIRLRRFEGYGLVALIVGLDILSPHVQTTQYSLIFAGFFTLYLCFWDEQRPALPRDRWISLGLASVAVVLGMGLSMIQMYPFIKYGPYAARVAGVQGWEYATSYAMPFANIGDWLLATFTGSSVWGVYWAGTWGKLHSEYLGASVLLLAAMGIVNPRRRLALLLGGCFVLFVLVCLGAQTPFYRLWYALVPGVKVTRAPGMAFFIPTFIVACFAAFGVERLERREPTRAPWIGFAIAALLLLLGASGALVQLAESMAPAERVEFVERVAGMIMLGAVLAAIAMAVTAGLSLAAIRGRVAGKGLALGLALVVSAELYINARRSFTWLPGATELFAPDTVIARVKATPLPYRALDLGESYPTAYLMYHRIPNVLGHHGNEIHAYDELLGGKNRWLNLRTTRLWNLLGVRYLMLPQAVEVPGYHVIARTTTPGASAAGQRVTEVVLYEADTIPPYARLVGGAVKVPDSEIVPHLMDPRLDYNRLVLLPETAGIELAPLDSIPLPMAARAQVTQWEPGRMTIRLDPAPERDGYLVLSENWYPEWEATVDGRAVRPLRGQRALLTIAAPRGARDVELKFRSPSYSRGRMMTLVSLAAILLLIAVPVIRRRRHA